MLKFSTGKAILAKRSGDRLLCKHLQPNLIPCAIGGAHYAPRMENGSQTHLDCAWFHKRPDRTAADARKGSAAARANPCRHALDPLQNWPARFPSVPALMIRPIGRGDRQRIMVAPAHRPLDIA